MNDEKHKRYTGKSNQIILDNFKQLVQDAKTTKITARTPVIPGFNDTVEELEEIQRFVAKGKNVSYEMLPYHRFGKGKCLEELIRWEIFYYQKKSKHISRNKMKNGGRKNVKVKQGTNNNI